MSKKLNLHFAFGIFLVGLFSANISQAQTYTNLYWNPSALGGTGTWNTSNVYWSTNSLGGGTLQASGSTTSNIYNFSGTAGTVSSSSSLTVGGLNWSTTGYTLTGTSTGVKFTGTDSTLTGTNAVSIANGVNLNITGSAATFDALGMTGGAGSTVTLTNATGATTTVIFGTTSAKSGRTNSVNTIISGAGTVVLGTTGSSGFTQAGNITNNSTGTFVLTNSTSGTVSVSGAISGSGAVTLANAGTGNINLTTSNSYSGGTIIQHPTGDASGAGSVGIYNSSAFGSGTVTIAGAGTNYIRSYASALNITNAITINSGSTLRLATSTSGWNETVSGVVSGAGGIYYTFTDTQRLLNTNNSFGGGVNIASSTEVQVNNIGSSGLNSSLGTNGVVTFSSISGAGGAGTLRWLGTSSENSDKTFALTTISSSASAGMKIYAGDTSSGGTNVTLTLNGNINSTAASNNTITLGAFNTNTLVMNGTINQAAGYTNSLVVGNSGAGTVVLGNTNNSFGGPLTINAGSGSTNTVQVAKIGNAGANSSIGTNGTINIGGSSSSGVNILKYVGTGETNDKVINLAGTTGGATLDQSGTGNLKFSSVVTATGVGAKTITLQGSTAGTGELAGAISDQGANAVSLTKIGSGAWTLSGVNTYTGLTTLGGGTNGGTLKIGLTNGLVNGVLQGTTSIGNVGALDLTAGGNYVMNSYGNSANSGNNMAFTNSSGTATTLTFTNANNYISQGSTGGRTLTNRSADLTIAFTGAVDIGSSTAADVVFTGPGSFILNGALNSTGSALRALTKSGDGTLTLNAASGYNGVTTLNLGTIALGANGTLGTNSLVMNAGTLAVGTSSSTIRDLTVNNGVITGSGTLNSANNFTFANTTTSTVSANLAGAAAVTQTGSSRVVLSGSNSFSGGLNLNSAGSGVDVTRAEALGAGTITAGSTNSRLGLNTITSLTITNAVNTGSSNTATMAFTPGAVGNSMTVTGLISGSGIAKVSGGGDLYLNNSGNTYSGGTEVGTGRIYVGSDRALGATTGAVNFGTTTNSLLAITSDVSFNASRNFTMSAAGYTANIDTGANNVTINGVIAPISGVTGGLLAKLGTGALTLGGNNTYSGGTIVSDGTLIGTTASLQGAITNNAAVIFNQSSSGSYANVMSGTGSLSKTNSGTVTLTRTNTYSGATTVSQGTLLVDTTGSIASSSATVNGGLLNVNGTAGAVTVNNGGSLGGAGTVGSVSLNSGGALNPGNSPGTLTAAQAIVMGGSTYNWQISNSGAGTTAGTDWDLFSVGGLLNMSNVTDANRWNLVVTADGAFTGWNNNNSPYEYIFAQAADLSLASGFSTATGTDVTSLFNITTSGFTSTSLPNYQYNAAGDFKVLVGRGSNDVITLNLQAVPEPSTGSMLGLGLAGLVATRLFRRKSS